MQTQLLVTVFLIAFSVPRRHFQTNKQYKVKTFSITTQQKMWSILEYTLKDKIFLRKICFLLCLAAQAVSPWVYFSLCTPPRCLYLFTEWIWVDGFLLKSTDISFVFAVLRMSTLTPFNKMFSGACPSSPSYKRLSKSGSSACLINVC